MKDKWDRQRELEREIEGKKKPTSSVTRALGYRLKDLRFSNSTGTCFEQSRLWGNI